MLNTDLVDDPRALVELAPAWRDLLRTASSPEPVKTPLWLTTWWRHFGASTGRRLRVIAIRSGGELIGVAPLCTRTTLHRRALPLRRAELLATYEPEDDEICSDYVGLVAARGREREVASALVEVALSGTLGGWDELALAQMGSDDPLVFAVMDALASRGVAVTRADSGACPFIALPSSFDAYLKQLESSQRYVVTRALRELEKWAGKGGYTLHRATTPAELAEGRRVLHSLHGERWSDKGREGVFASARFTAFHDEVMPELLKGGPEGTLDLLWLTVKGDPIGAVYNIVYDGKVHFYQSGRKLDVPKNLKPGIALHALAIQRAIELGYREYDFLNGASQYKLKLATATRPLVTLRALAPTVRARALDLGRALVDHAAARARAFRAARSPSATSEEPAAEAAPRDDGPSRAKSDERPSATS